MISPVQNGKAEGTLSVTATFQPECVPPTSVVHQLITLVDRDQRRHMNIPAPSLTNH